MNRISEILEKRKEIYSLLSSLFLGNVPEKFVHDLIEGHLRLSGSTDIEEGLRMMKEFVMERKSSEEAVRDIEDEYSRLFLLSHAAPLTKSEVVENADYGRTSLEVEEKVRKMGYRIVTNTVPPDHISAQFDFIATLIENSIRGEEDFRESLEKQIEFLENEIMTWVPEVLRELEKCGEFYSGVARFAGGFLSTDRNILRELRLW